MVSYLYTCLLPAKVNEFGYDMLRLVVHQGSPPGLIVRGSVKFFLRRVFDVDVELLHVETALDRDIRQITGAACRAFLTAVGPTFALESLVMHAASIWFGHDFFVFE